MSVQCYCKLVLAGHPTPACPCERVHRRTSLMSSLLLFQKYPACLIRLIWIVLEMGGRWSYSCCFVGCCFKVFIIMVRRIPVQLALSLFSIRLVSVYVVHTYGNKVTTTAWKKTAIYFIGYVQLSYDRLSIEAVRAFTCHVLMPFSVVSPCRIPSTM